MFLSNSVLDQVLPVSGALVDFGASNAVIVVAVVSSIFGLVFLGIAASKLGSPFSVFSIFILVFAAVLSGTLIMADNAAKEVVVKNEAALLKHYDLDSISNLGSNPSILEIQPDGPPSLSSTNAIVVTEEGEVISGLTIFVNYSEADGVTMGIFGPSEVSSIVDLNEISVKD